MNTFICTCLFYLIGMFLSSSTVFHYKDILYLTNPLSLNISVVSNFFHQKQYLKTDTFITKLFTHIFIFWGKLSEAAYVPSRSVKSNSLQTHGLYVAHQVPLSVGFSRQEHQSGLPFPPPGDLPNQGSYSSLLHWQMDSLPVSYLGSPISSRHTDCQIVLCPTVY